MTRRSSKTDIQELKDELAALRELFGQSRRELAALSARADVEHPDPTPVEMPIDYGGPPTLAELVNEAVARQLGQLTGVSPPMDPDPAGEDWEEDDPDHIPFTVDEMVAMEDDLPGGSESHEDGTSPVDGTQAPLGAEDASAAVQEPRRGDSPDPQRGSETEATPVQPSQQ